MDSQPGGAPSKRITRSWYPGGRVDARPRRSTPLEAAAYPNQSPGLGTNVGYWGRVDSEGDFEEGSGFLDPIYRSRLPWRLLFVAVRRILPLTVAALVGAVTALAWQSYMIGPAKTPATRPTPALSAGQGAGTTEATSTKAEAAAQPAVFAHAPAQPTTRETRPAPEMLLGSAPAQPAAHASTPAERSPSAKSIARTARTIDRRPAAAKLRSTAAKAPADRVTPAPARHGRAADPDAILPPAFM